MGVMGVMDIRRDVDVGVGGGLDWIDKDTRIYIVRCTIYERELESKE